MIKTDQLTKIFKSGKKKVTAIENINLKISKREFVLIKGPSGCGKSTLLFSIGGLLRPSLGTVNINGIDIYSMPGKKLTEFRSRKIGFVFQSYYLLPYLSVIDNILITNKLKGFNISRDEAKAITALLNINHRLNHKPSELSVGEKQRVALARTLIMKPEIILADEPTGNLDPENAVEVLKSLKQFKEQGGTVLFATHGNEADTYATYVLNMGNEINQ